MKDLITFYDILSKIYDDFGSEAFRSKKFIAILSDIASNYKEEIIVTKKLFNNGIINKIIDEDCDESSVDREVSKYSMIIQDEELIPSEISSPCIQCFIYLFNDGLNLEKVEEDDDIEDTDSQKRESPEVEKSSNKSKSQPKTKQNIKRDSNIAFILILLFFVLFFVFFVFSMGMYPRYLLAGYTDWNLTTYSVEQQYFTDRFTNFETALKQDQDLVSSNEGPESLFRRFRMVNFTLKN